MSILNIIKPKWQHSDPEVRRRATLALEPSQTDILQQIVLQDTDQKVRAAALSLINDIVFLDSLSAGMPSEQTAQQITERLDTLLLEKFARSEEPAEQYSLLQRLDKDALLIEAAVLTADIPLRLAVVDKIYAQESLAELITRQCGKVTGARALERITEKKLLQFAAQHASHRSIRATAQQMLDALEAQSLTLSEEQLNKESRAELLAKAAGLVEDWNIERAQKEIKNIETELLERGLLPESRESRQFKDYQETITRKFDEHTRQLARDREKKLERKRKRERLTAIIQTIEEISLAVTGNPEHCFSQLQDEWQHIVSSLHGKIPSELEEQFREHSRFFIKKRKAINSELLHQEGIRKEIAKAQKFTSQKHFEKAVRCLDQAHSSVTETAFRFLSADALLAAITEQRLAVDLARQEAAQQITQKQQHNLSQRTALLSEVNSLLQSADQVTASLRIKEIEQLLAKAVELPEGSEVVEEEIRNSLLRFYEHINTIEKEKDWQLWQNKLLKEELITQVALLETEQDLFKVFKEIKEAQNRWKEIGPVPQKESNRLWSRFQTLTDTQFQRCQLFFQQKDAEAEVNLAHKIELCILAEEQQESVAWNKSAQFFKELQGQWKTVGPAPKEKEEEVFARFRKACDHFFERRSQHYLERDKIKNESLAQKLAICERIEAFVQEPDLSHHKEIKELQAQWKTIGEVPKDQIDALWQRFRTACTSYYSWFDSLKPANQKAQEELCDHAAQIVASINEKTNFKECAGLIRQLQTQWKAIGPVPLEVKDDLWKKFRSTCDIFFKKQKRYFDAIDRQRAANELLKKEILREAISLSRQDSKESARQIIELQERWKSIGSASQANERRLQKEFQEVCNTFFKERREASQELDTIRRENLKNLEALCLRLEIIAGIGTKSKAQKNSPASLTLGEQLKLAFESNFVLAGDQKDKQRRKKDEIKSIEEQARAVGELPPEHEHAMRKRFQTALQAAIKVAP